MTPCVAGKSLGGESQLRLDIVWVKIQSCLTFASLAQLKYELLDMDAQRFLTDGYQEFLDLHRLFASCVDLPPKVKQQVQAEIAYADERLHEIERQVGPAGVGACGSVSNSKMGLLENYAVVTFKKIREEPPGKSDFLG